MILSWLRMFLALGLLIFLFGFVGNFDYAEDLRIEAEEKEARPHRRAHAELMCGCLKVNRGKWLRLEVVHQPDRKFCRAVCFYDGGTTTKGTL